LERSEQVLSANSEKARRVSPLLDDCREAGEEVRRARGELETARQRLREAILAAAAEKIPYSEIARACGLSHERVRQIAHGR
jgi:DNA-directed RNA polymerase specialized sigma24 family protein